MRPAHRLLANVRRLAKKALHVGGALRCPVCVSSVRGFASFGIDPRPDALCPICGSLERHRLAWLFLEKRSNLIDGSPKRMLHFAPEPILVQRLRDIPGLRHVTADVSDPRAMVRIDITRIPYEDASFDVVYCSHVLEHVPDDRAAMREVRRIVRRNGWVLFQVPITAEITMEDPTVTDPEERLRRFGQCDHVRRYGRDFTDRLREAGFTVSYVSGADLVDRRSVSRYGLADESLFVCT